MKTGKLSASGIPVLLALLAAPAASAENASIEEKYGVIEVVNAARIVLDVNTLRGYVDAPVCNRECEDTRLAITPETEVSVNGKKRPLKTVKSRLGRDVSIIYDPESLSVVNISW